MQVSGAGRVGASVVTLLAAAGVGRWSSSRTPASAQAADVAPAGSRADDVGARRQDAAVAGRAPGRALGAPPLAAGPDRPGPRRARHRFRRSTRGSPTGWCAPASRTCSPGCARRTGVVGPLVLPGRSSCQRCHDLHRADRDPAWPSIAAQLTGDSAPAHRGRATSCSPPRSPRTPRCRCWPSSTATRRRPPPTVDGTLEIAQADGRVRRRGPGRRTRPAAALGRPARRRAGLNCTLPCTRRRAGHNGRRERPPAARRDPHGQARGPAAGLRRAGHAGVSASRLGGRPAEIVAAEVQARTAEQLFRVLGELKGGAMKFGQAMSVFEAALPENLAGPYRETLTQLQESAPPLPARTVHAVLATQLGHRLARPVPRVRRRPGRGGLDRPGAPGGVGRRPRRSRSRCSTPAPARRCSPTSTSSAG